MQLLKYKSFRSKMKKKETIKTPLQKSYVKQTRNVVLNHKHNLMLKDSCCQKLEVKHF
jgi:hypothetical protein